MGVWPVIVWEWMYSDNPVRLVVGDRVRWDVDLVDGAAGVWPIERLVQTTVEIEERSPEWVYARAPELVARWTGAAPAGSRFEICAALEADWLNPHGATVSGAIKRIYQVWVAVELAHYANGRPFYRPAPVTGRQLVEVPEIDWIPSDVVDGQKIDSLLVELDIDGNEVA
jgi:hypothetical protein